MSITPVAAKAPAPSNGVPASDPGEAAGFADLVQQHMDTGGLPAEGRSRVLDEAASPTAAPSDGLAAMLAGLVAAGTAVSGTAGSSSAEGAGLSDGEVEGLVDADDTGAARGTGAADVVVAKVAAGRGAEGSGAAGSGATGSGAAGLGAAAGAVESAGAAPLVRGDLAAPGPGQVAGDQAVGTGAHPQASTDGSTVAVDAAAGGDGASTSTNSGAGDRPSSAAAVLGSASVSSASAASGSAEGVRGNPVADQVFDHVTRLVSRGDGTHRITLRLHPADLGEVKVVLTVKNGTVDVTLAAGSAAREALREGSPQLRSLLEMAGATTGQVVVRDLGGGPAASTAAQQQAAGSSPDHGQQQSQDDRDGFAEAREDGFDGFADGGFDEDRPGDGPDRLDREGARRGAGDLADAARDDARASGRPGPHAAAGAQSARSSLFIPSRLDLNL